MVSHSTSSIARRVRNALTVATLSLTVFGIAHAQPSLKSLHRFDIAAQSTSDALNSFAKQAGLRLLFPYDVLENRNTDAINGEFSAEEVLQKLLAGTELKYEITKDSVVLIRAPEAASSSSSISALDSRALGNSPAGLRLAQAETSQSDATSQSDSSSSGAPAAPGLEEIVVTAEKREESIQDLPIAISAFSDETLINRGIVGLNDLAQLAPSVQVIAEPNAVRVSVRGISSETFTEDSAVAVSRDGVSYSSPRLFPGDFFDVERVEVLRGPQGTISGRNATAGAIHIHSKRPTEEFEGGVKATYGNYDRLGLDGFLSGPIAGERLLGRLAVRTDRSDGWLTNMLPGQTQQVGSIDKRHVRASLLAHLTDNFEAHLILEDIRDRSNPAHLYYIDQGRLRSDTPTLTEALGVPAFDRDSNTAHLSLPNEFDKEHKEARLRLTWQLGPSAQLTAVTGYARQEMRWTIDDDGTLLPRVGVHDLAPNPKEVSQEVTLTADLTDRLDMIVGGQYLDGELARDGRTVVLPNITRVLRDSSATTWAGYTQWRYRLTDQIRVTGGVRYNHDTEKVEETRIVNDVPGLRQMNEESWNAWTPRFAVDYAPSDDLTLYASASRDYKSGEPGTATASAFNPEYVWNYEAGVKANWLDRRVRTALSGFYMDYTDLQQILLFYDADIGAIRSDRLNVGAATIKGVELELEALVTDRLRFTFGGTWLDGIYDELQQPDPLFPELGAPLPQAPTGPNFRDLSNNRLIRSAEWQFNASSEYRAPLPLNILGGDLQGVLRASYAWQDKVYFSIFNHEAASQGAYGLLNLSGAIEAADGRWELSAFAYNVTDKAYYPHVAAIVGLFSVPFSAAAGVGQPRRYGISLAYRF